MSPVVLDLQLLGLRRPPLEEHRKTLFVATLILLGLVLIAYTSDVEEEEDNPSKAIAGGAFVILVLVFLYDSVSLIHTKAEPLIANSVICIHCMHLNPITAKSKAAGPSSLECKECKTKLLTRKGLAKVNYGAVLTSMGMPKLFEYISQLKLEYAATLGERPPRHVQVEGDLVKGDKTVIKESVLDKTVIGGPAPVPVAPPENEPEDLDIEEEVRYVDAVGESKDQNQREPEGPNQKEGDLETSGQVAGEQEQGPNAVASGEQMTEHPREKDEGFKHRKSSHLDEKE